MTASIPHVRRRVKSYGPAKLTECECVVCPICPCEMFPKGKLGAVIINGQDYAIGYHGSLPREGEPVVRGYFLIKADGTKYDLERSSCDCPDATFRGRCCKHLLAVEHLLDSGDLLPITPEYPISF